MINRILKAPLNFGYNYPIVFWALIGIVSLSIKNTIAYNIYLSKYDHWIQQRKEEIEQLNKK